MGSTDYYNEDLIVRYLDGECTREEALTIESLLKSDARYKQHFNEIRFIWEQTAISSTELEKDWSLIRQRIGFGKKQASPFAFFLRAAAVIIMVFSVSASLWVYWNVPGYGRWVVFETGATSDSLVLPDASIVYLNRNSSLKFRNAFAGPERHVALKGEGYFEVAKDLEKPFKVEVGPVSVNVLGTAFHLDGTRADGLIELNVTEGIVNLSNRRESNQIYAGEWAIANAKVMGKGVITNNNFISWKTGLLEFNEASLSDISVALRNHFPEINDVIIYNQSNIKVTTRFKGQHLDEITEELSVHFQKNFALKNGTLIISD